MDSKEFYAALRAYFSALDEREIDALTVRFRDGKEMSIDLPARSFAERHGGMTERELLFMSFVPDIDKPGMSAKQLAAKAGYEGDRHVRRILKSMMSKGLVVMDANGYRKAKLP